MLNTKSFMSTLFLISLATSTQLNGMNHTLQPRDVNLATTSDTTKSNNLTTDLQNFMNAIRDGDLSAVKTYLRQYGNPDFYFDPIAKHIRALYPLSPLDLATNKVMQMGTSAQYQILEAIVNTCQPGSLSRKHTKALHMIAKTDLWDAIGIFIQARFPPNEFDSNGNTPLHIAAQHNQYFITSQLLQHPDISIIRQRSEPWDFLPGRKRLLPQDLTTDADLQEKLTKHYLKQLNDLRRLSDLGQLNNA